MSEAILDLISREQMKAERRRKAAAATASEIEILGDTPARKAKLVRQEMAVQESLNALEKLNAALKKK